jgi:hypothetical protein
VRRPIDRLACPLSPLFPLVPDLSSSFLAQHCHGRTHGITSAPAYKATAIDDNDEQGAVYVYTLNPKTKLYEQVAGPLVPSMQANSYTGTSISVSGDGKTICAGQYRTH